MALKRRQLRTVKDIADAGLIEPERIGALSAVAARYAVAITPAIAGLIDADDTEDPIARQFVPHGAELETPPNEQTNPIGDESHHPVKGLLPR